MSPVPRGRAGGTLCGAPGRGGGAGDDRGGVRVGGPSGSSGLGWLGGLRLVSRDAASTVVALDGEGLTEGLADLRWRLDELMAAGCQELVVDIAAVAHLSSTTVSALLLARRRCHARGGRLVLRSPSRRCREVLASTGLAPVFGLDERADHPA